MTSSKVKRKPAKGASLGFESPITVAQATHAVIAIDPGKHHAGFAIFLDGKLAHAGITQSPSTRNPPIDGTYRRGHIDPHSVDLAVDVMREVRPFAALCAPCSVDVVAELPHVYVDENRRLRTPADPNDLLFLAFTCGLTMAMIDSFASMPMRFRLVEPGEWKGQVPAEIFYNRIRAMLGPAEIKIAKRERVYEKEDRATFHHGLEAIGLGLWALWRL